jgi:hypothetical protein
LKEGDIYKHYRGEYFMVANEYKREDGERMVCFKDKADTRYAMTIKKFNSPVRANLSSIQRFNLVRKDKGHPWMKPE